jgi:NIMA (never in mitosis gene a)-related kinase
MEYCPNGDAGGLIKKCQQLRQRIPESVLIDLFTQICFGLNVCHSSHVLHRDIKTDNIYMSKANVAKLGDFGVSRNLNSTVDMSKTMAGTPYYMSPEILRGDLFPFFFILRYFFFYIFLERYNLKSDMWSMGVVFYEMV